MVDIAGVPNNTSQIAEEERISYKLAAQSAHEGQAALLKLSPELLLLLLTELSGVYDFTLMNLLCSDISFLIAQLLDIYIFCIFDSLLCVSFYSAPNVANGIFEEIKAHKI